MAVPVIFNSVNVNGQYQNTTISIGAVTQAGWSAHSKNNFANGPLFGANLVAAPLNVIYDPDVIDTTIPDPDVITSLQNQQA